jgi:hypothetical protein
MQTTAFSAFVGSVVRKTTSDATPSNVLICQFEANYQISEITEDIRSKLLLAVSNTLGVDASLLVLAFAEVDLSLRSEHRVQVRGVLVSVSLKVAQGSTTPAFAPISQESLNIRMNLLGLRAVKLVSNVFAPSTTQGLPHTYYTVVVVYIYYILRQLRAVFFVFKHIFIIIIINFMLTIVSDYAIRAIKRTSDEYNNFEHGGNFT